MTAWSLLVHGAQDAAEIFSLADIQYFLSLSIYDPSNNGSGMGALSDSRSLDAVLRRGHHTVAPHRQQPLGELSYEIYISHQFCIWIGLGLLASRSPWLIRADLTMRGRFISAFMRARITTQELQSALGISHHVPFFVMVAIALQVPQTPVNRRFSRSDPVNEPLGVQFDNRRSV